ncbi:MAG: transporter substrate-binding domain-containing protein [Bdellovibrionota bacterium]
MLKTHHFRRLFLLASLALMSYIVSSPLFAADALEKIKKAGVLKIGLDAGFLPFEMRTPQGEWIGFDIDMMNAFAKTLGVKAEFISSKWEGIIPGLMTNKYDLIVSGMTINPERAKVVLFSEPYYDAGLMILLAAKNKASITSIANLDQKGKIIALKLGTTGDIFASKTFKNAELRRLDSEADAAQTVALGKADAFIYDKPFIEIFAASRSDKVAVLSDVVSKEQLGVAAHPKNKPLIEAYNAFLAGWRKSGEYDKAYKANFVDLAWKAKFPEGAK